MFEVVFGSKTVEKILIFLFVNGTCYGNELHRLLDTALTPIQKGLQRLESGGIVLSDFKGKTRIYRFNPGFPLLHELEKLLKKIYTLLPPEEKKHYHMAKMTALHSQKTPYSTSTIVKRFWERLSSVQWLTFYAESKAAKGWKREGKGEVLVTQETSHCLIFREQGMWSERKGQKTNFTNTFRWTLDPIAGMIGLEHLRRGIERPVFLFHLAPSSPYLLSSIDSHLCEGDTYFGQVHMQETNLRLKWRVIGAEKNEEIDYFYTAIPVKKISQ